MSIRERLRAFDLPMQMSTKEQRWSRHFVVRAERTRTTWQLRVGLVTFVLLVLWLLRGWWTVALASSLVCEANSAPSDALLVENFDSDYLIFKRAESLRQAGLAPRVLVPVETDSPIPELNAVALAIVDVMVKVSGLANADIVP